MMPERLDPKKAVTHDELLMAQIIQMDASALLLFEKGVITQAELFDKLKRFKAEYENRKRS
jgi:hypothetical protein